MRKSLWMIPVVLLLTALGSTSARADTIVDLGGNVTAINGITIAGTTYDVTFGTTIDTTFAGDAADAMIANADIEADLNTVTAETAGGECLIGVDGGLTAYNAASGFLGCGGGGGPWFTISGDTTAYEGLVFNGFALWDEFTAAPITTPEPGPLSLTLTGVGLIGLTLVIRKRKAHDLAQTT